MPYELLNYKPLDDIAQLRPSTGQVWQLITDPGGRDLGICIIHQQLQGSLALTGTGPGAGSANDSGIEGPNHGEALALVHHSLDWSTARSTLRLERGARALVITNLTGKLIEGSNAIPYVKPRLGNGVT